VNTILNTKSLQEPTANDTPANDVVDNPNPTESPASNENQLPALPPPTGEITQNFTAPQEETKIAEEPPTFPGLPNLDSITDEGIITQVDTTLDSIDIDEAAEQFGEAIANTLSAHAEPIPDRAIHRFDDPEKRPGNKNCWLYMDETGTYGRYGNWGTDERYEWYLDDFEAISDEEQARIHEKVEAAKQQRVQDCVKGHDITAKKAAELFNSAEPADSTNPYLQKKLIPPANARQFDNKLLIPLHNIDGDIRTIQWIWPSGKKRFMKDGEINGNFALIGADELPTEDSLIVCEGWATGVTLHLEHGWPVAAAMNAGNLDKVCKVLLEKLPDTVTLIIAADDDRRTEGNPGLTKALAVGDAIGAEVIRPEFPCTDCDCTDFNDVAACKRRDKPDKAGESTKESIPSNTGPTSNQPIPLTTSLPPVKPLTQAMLPKSFVGFVTDVSTRLQIPADYIAVCAIAVNAGIVGAKYRIHPKQLDDWLVTSTMWAGLVGPPSTMKSAVMGAAQQPLHELEKELAATFAEALEIHNLDNELADDHLKEIKKKAKEIYSEDPDKAIQTIRDAQFTSEPPTQHRYTVNDVTIEKFGELLRDNPNGMLLVRDELSGWFAKMVQEDYQGDRAFYLECFEGLNPFICDRIGRGTIAIDNCVLSIIGGIQPSKIAPVIQGAIQGTVDDGLIQRFQLAVWPDVQKGWKWIDQKPDQAAYASYRDALWKLHELPVSDSEGSSTNLRFSKPAQALYITWTEQIQAQIRSDDLHPVMQSHLAKMPKTIAGLALLFELIDGGRANVGKKATARAILWADYLQSHAERLYSLSAGQGMIGAKLILSRHDKLPEIFTARNVQRKSWTGLSSRDAVADALDCLVDHRYLTELPVPTNRSGGRPTMRYRWHASLKK
jgi:putative DNA primase/helicase